MNKRQKNKLENRLRMEYLRWYYPEIRSTLRLKTVNVLNRAIGMCLYDPSELCQHLDEDRPVAPRYRRSTMSRLVYRNMIRWINKLQTSKRNKLCLDDYINCSTACEAQFLDD